MKAIHAILAGGLLAALALWGCAQNPARPDHPSASTPSGSPAAPATRPAGPFGREVARLVYQPDEVVSVLDNGLVVIAKRVNSPVLSVQAFVRTGGAFEGKWLGGGLSHLLEHLVAGGSNARRSEAEGRIMLQQIGNDSNAGTSLNYTVYYINTTADNLDPAVDIITGWLFTASITPEEYRREYEVVQRELEMGQGEPSRVFWKLMLKNRYLVSPAGVPVIGYKEVIQGLTRDDVYAYYKLAYQPNNMVIALAGDLDPQQMLLAVQKHVAEVPPGREFDRNIAQEPPVLWPRTMVGTFPSLGQAQLCLAFPSVRLSHPDAYALDMLAAVLGQGESSILVETIRDEKQIATSVSTSNWTPDFVDGTFMINLNLPADRIPQATAAVLAEIERIKRDGVSKDRLGRAKTQMRAQRAFSQQTSEAVAESLAQDFLSTGDPHFSDRALDRWAAVTPEQVKQVAVQYLNSNQLLTTALVPEEAAGSEGLPRAVDLLRPSGPATQAPRQSAGKVVRTELGDGTILLLKRVPTAPIAVIQMYALGGLTAEDQQTNGLGNLTMQTLVRGTRTRSARDIAEFFDAIGGDISTQCGNNSWSWSAACLKDDLARTLEVFADVVKNPAFAENEVAAMKNRIAQTIARQDADWMSQSMRFFRGAYFGPANSPYQFMPIGTKQNVQGFTPQQMRDWYENRILKARRVLAIYGDIDIDQARTLAAAQFGAERPSPPAIAAPPQSPALPAAAAGQASVTVRRVHVRKSANPQCGVVIGFAADPVIGSQVNYPLTLADVMTSGYNMPTGYLHEVLRGRGLVYVVHAYVMPGRSAEYPGAFVVYAGCDPKNATKVVDLILENVARLQGSAADIQADWFERAKRLTITSDAMDNQTPSAQAQTAALNELFGLGHDHHERFAGRIGALGLADVQSVARGLLRECVVTVNTSDPEAVKVREGTRVFTSFPPVDLTPRGVEHDSPSTGR